MPSRRVLALLCLSTAIGVAPLAAQKSPDLLLNNGRVPGSASSGNQVLRATGGVLDAVYTDYRRGTGNIYWNHSADGGRTWRSTERMLSNGGRTGISNAYAPDLAIEGSLLTVAWLDDRNGTNDIYFNRSANGGTTWLQNPVRINRGGVRGVTVCYDAQVAVSGTTVFVVWTDDRSGVSRLYGNRSTDGGQTFLANDVLLDHGGGTVAPSDPQLETGAGCFFLSWTGFNGTTADIYFQSSFDAGVTWQANDAILNVGAPASNYAYGARMAVMGQVVAVGWFDARGNGLDYDLYLNRSMDGGLTWNMDTRLSQGLVPGSAVVYGSAVPSLAFGGGNLYVVWGDDRATPPNAPLRTPDVYLSRSTDFGATWSPSELRLDTGRSPGVAQSWFPQVSAEGQNVAVVWNDDRHASGMQDLYANRSVDGGATWLAADVRINVGSTPGTTNVGMPVVAVSGGTANVLWDDNRNDPIGSNSDLYFNLAFGYQGYGSGLAGTGAQTPQLTGTGAPALGGSIDLDITNGRGGAPAVVVLGLGPAAVISQPLLGGTLLVAPATTLFVQLGGPPGVPGAGSGTQALPVPVHTTLLGLSLDCQALLLDAGAVQGVAMTAAVTAWIG